MLDFHRIYMSRRAIITGVTGQDGSYLAELLLSKGYEVVGAVRRASAPNFWRIQHLLDRITLKPADLLDQLSLIRLVEDVRPHEFYNLAAVSGMLFNHESPRRGLEFVTRKVTDGVARIKLGLADTLSLGNLDAHRDWGFAGDYVGAMWLMLQRERHDDYVIATGISHSVRDLVEVAFAHVGLDWRKYVALDPKLIRPAEVEHLIGDNSKARAELGWTPSVDFTGLVKMMVDADLERVASAPKVGDRLSTF